MVDPTDAAESQAPGDDRRVIELMKEYKTELESGRRPDPRTFLARYPDLAQVLTPALAGLDMLFRGAKDFSRVRASTSPLHTGLGPGDRVGEFVIAREVGRGGMGVVYEATQPSLNRRVALKV